MAVVNSNQQPGERPKPTPVDMFAEEAPQGKPAQVDVFEDAFTRSAPPPAGPGYSLQLFPGDGEDFGVTQYLNRDGTFNSYSIPVVCQITDHTNEDLNGVQIISRVSTRINRGKNISTCIGLLCKLGYESQFLAGKEYSDRVVGRFLIQVLKKHPVIKGCELDWRGSYTEKNAKGDDEWTTVARTIKDFPQDPEHPGEYLHTYPQTSKSGASVMVVAQPFIKVWGGKQMQQPKVATATMSRDVSPPKQQDIQINGQPQPQLKSMPKSAAAKLPAQPAKQAIPDSGEDEDLILA